MKKLLKIIGIFNLCIISNSTLIACENNNYISTNFFEIKGTKGELRSLTHDKNYIYIGSNNGNVYKSNGNDNFQEMSGTQGSIDYLITDSENNVYAEGEPNNFYTAQKDSINFNPMSWPSGSISFLTKDNNDGIWAGNSTGGVYWYSNKSYSSTWKEKTIFSSLGGILDFKINKYGVIYILNDKGEIFKCFNSDEESSLKKIWTKENNEGINNLLIDEYNNVYVIGNDKIYKSDGDNEFKVIYSLKNIIKNQ